MTKSSDDFPNNWGSVLDSDFIEVDFDDVIQRSGSWLLPSSVYAIVRLETTDGLVSEKAAKNKRELNTILRSARKEDSEYTVFTQDDMTWTYSTGGDDE